MTASLAVIGASWGGMQAVCELLSELRPDVSLPIVLAQHRAGDNDETLESYLQRHTPLGVVPVEDKQPIEPGHVYVAPPDYHLLVEPGCLSLSTEGPVRYSRPSIDVLFETAADAYAEGVVAVVLTGANDDGCRGALAVKEAGGTTIAQDPATAERPEMPASAIAAGAIDLVLPIVDIARELARLGRAT